MKQITLHVYQSIDGCPVRSDKYFDAAVDASGCVLIDEETYLRIYLNHLGWPLTAKETLVVTDGCIDLTEKERVRFVTGDAAAELRGIKADGEGTVTAYPLRITPFTILKYAMIPRKELKTESKINACNGASSSPSG